jgi:anti-sigma-K factor RskA
MHEEELTYNEILDKLTAYALGALEPEEMLAVDAYIRKHEALLAHLEESEQAAVQLAYLAPTAPLPADAKTRLLQRVRADLGAKQADATETRLAPDLTPSQQAETGSKALKRARPIAKEGWLSNLRVAIPGLNRWAWAAGGALVVLLIVVGIYAGQVSRELSRLQAETARLQTELSQAQTDLNALRAEVTQLQTDKEQLQQINQDLSQQLQTEQSRLTFIANAAPDRTILLPGTDEAPEASGLLYLGQNDQALLLLNNLAPLSAQQTYQLWLIPENEAPIPVSLLAVQSTSPTWLDIQIPPEARNFAKVGVSTEPAGGSLSPTGPIVLLGTVG